MSGKRGYRYRITHSTREGVEVGEHIVDWTYFGRGHTWTIFNYRTGEDKGSFTGVYLDKGYVDDGQYRTDAELAAAVERTQE